MEEYVIVKETVTVTRYHLVKATEKQAIKAVKDCDKSALYLTSCDDINWDAPIQYETEKLKEDWKKDKRLLNASRHISELLEEKDLTNEPKAPIIKKRKKPPEFDSLKLLEEVE